MGLLRQITKATMGAVLPRNRFLIKGGELSTEAAEDQTVISLTFDDGPHPTHTPPVLDALDAADWTGTFFIIGRHAQKHPELVREIVERGHEVANHTFTHSEPRLTSPAKLIEEVLQTRSLIAELTGRGVNLMRPPKGRLSLSKAMQLWRARQTVVLWNCDSKDFEMAGDEEAIDWASTYRPKFGDIVLLHDRAQFAATIARTLAGQHGENLRSVGISAWLAGSAERRVTKELQVAGGT